MASTVVFDNGHRATQCGSCAWWQSPVVVGGEEGSGTRGAAETLRGLGVHLSRCDINSAGDSGCIQASLEWQVAARAYVDLREGELRCNLTLDMAISRTMEPGRARRAIGGVPTAARRPWAWGWKMPHMMWTLPALRVIFPCLRYVHALRDPRDLATDPMSHLGMRANHLKALAVAYGCEPHTCAEDTAAASFMCNQSLAAVRPYPRKEPARPERASRCRGLVRPLPRSIPRRTLPGGWEGGHPPEEFMRRVRSSAPVRLGLQCLVLMEWVGNVHVVEWAGRFLHPDAGLVLYQSEAMAGAAGSGLGSGLGSGSPLIDELRCLVGQPRARCPRNSTRTGLEAEPSSSSSSLRRHWLSYGPTSPGPSSSSRDTGPTSPGTRRLSYGEWRSKLSAASQAQLEDCGDWRIALEALSNRTRQDLGREESWER